jgi:hypothetical protein
MELRFLNLSKQAALCLYPATVGNAPGPTALLVVNKES